MTQDDDTGRRGPDLDEGEGPIHALMSALRDYTVQVSSAFSDRVSEEIDRIVDRSRDDPSVGSMLGGLLVQVVNLVCGLAGVQDEDPGQRNKDGAPSGAPTEDDDE